jgi:hypothetical protein
MSPSIETRRFRAADSSGNRHTVLAERDAIPAFGGIVRTGPWCFRLETGGRVLPREAHGHYTIAETGVHLTTSDPNEPKD